jgi:hypothetical protein
VAEDAPTGNEPDDADEDHQAFYWVRVNSERRQQALQLEEEHQVVLCDSDPLKLHYYTIRGAWPGSGPRRNPGLNAHRIMRVKL